MKGPIPDDDDEDNESNDEGDDDDEEGMTKSLNPHRSIFIPPCLKSCELPTRRRNY